MIPKKIHYCWFGGKPLNKLGRKCLKSWKKFFPDYEIIEWNEQNFDLENCCEYVKQAYKAKKWAFVSDYVRFKVLYEQGGVYFDTDVEVIKTFDDILEKGAFMGCENPTDTKMAVAPGLGFAVEKGNAIIKLLLEDYEKSSFYNEDGSLNLYTVVDRATDILKKYGLQNTKDIQVVEGITIYPNEYFCPINMETGKMEKTENTRSIHRYSASWESPKARMRGKIYFILVKIFGVKFAEKVRGKLRGK